MDVPAPLPHPSPQTDRGASLHATAVSIDGRGLLIIGPAGAGKSSLAAQMIVAGAGLIADDLVMLRRHGGDLHLARPTDATASLELRGIGPSPVRPAMPVRCAGAVLLAPSLHRLPEPEIWTLLGTDLPLIRHPPTPDLYAKLIIWIRAGPLGTTHPVPASDAADRRTTP